VKGWNKYDDPMTASQNIILELKQLGVELDMPPNKLKSGHGEGVCEVLMKLGQITLANKFRFRRPVIKEEDQGADEDADDLNGDEMDGGADLADVIHAQDSDEDIDEDMDFGGGNIHNDLAKQMEADMQQNAIITSNVSKEKWQIEVERVAHKLKINKNAADGKEWRSHLD
jgi:intraflagellar transport protein 57